MRKDYNQLTNNIRARLNPDNIILEKAFTDKLSGISYSDVRRFVRFAMKAPESEYTKNSKAAGEKVKAHLQSCLRDVEYRYQGSVMTNTHIKGHSDIDLLTISTKFYYHDQIWLNEYLDNPAKRNELQVSFVEKLEKQRQATKYLGNDLEDLRQIRLDSEIKLNAVYLDCDISNPKAIKVFNRNLKKDVDVVTANWYDDVLSIVWDKGENRGIVSKSISLCPLI